MEKEEIIVAEKQTEILLESGTNELELLEFMVALWHQCGENPRIVPVSDTDTGTECASVY